MNVSTVEDALLLGCARRLGQHELLTWHEDPAVPYAPDEVGVRIGESPLEGRSVALELYDDQPIDRSSTWLLLQARIRGSADPLDRTLLAAVRDRLDDARHPEMPAPARVTVIRLTSVARLGLLGGAQVWTANFRALTARSSAWQ